MQQLDLFENKCGIEIKMPVLVRTEYLIPNPWNPNKVAKPEMDLLRVSIRKSGFCFPLIVIKESETRYMIVDGFHRHLLAKEFKMPEVPVVILDEPVSELMNATIRFNRAKGTHQIDRMSNIVKELIMLGCTPAEICKNLGMDADEVLRLKQNSGIAEIFKDTDYSHSWEPTDGDITHQERGNPPHQTRT
jgi:ParB-like chromosome segregation protein Spo0J